MRAQDDSAGEAVASDEEAPVTTAKKTKKGKKKGREESAAGEDVREAAQLELLLMDDAALTHMAKTGTYTQGGGCFDASVLRHRFDQATHRWRGPLQRSRLQRRAPPSKARRRGLPRRVPKRRQKGGRGSRAATKRTWLKVLADV